MEKIIINEPILKKQRLTSKVTIPKDLEKFFKTDTLFIEYDTDIVVDESILNIPLTATLLPLAWLTGTDIYIRTIDKKFKESMDNLQKMFSKLYPLAHFKTKIHTEKITQNKIGEINPHKRTGLLFSGGVDSTYSLITNMNLNPRLIMMWGVDNFPYPEHSDHWVKATSLYRGFAKRKKLEFNIIKTNISQILNNRRIGHYFHKELYNGNFRAGIQHSLILIPVTAPLSIDRFNHIVFAASSHIGAYNPSIKPRATVPVLDEKIVWADLSVKHDGYLVRNYKIFGAIADYLKNDELILRVCLRSKLVEGNLNDSTCEKCLRTIAPLVIAGYDPNKIGFKVDETTFKRMRNLWEKRKTAEATNHWLSLQQKIPDEIESDIYGAKEFFEWFRDFDFKSTEKNWFWTDLYMQLPYQAAYYLDKIYRKLGINVHEDPYNRTRKVSSS